MLLMYINVLSAFFSFQQSIVAKKQWKQKKNKFPWITRQMKGMNEEAQENTAEKSESELITFSFSLSLFHARRQM